MTAISEQSRLKMVAAQRARRQREKTMTTDLRELLKEARDELEAMLDIQASPDLKRFIDRIDAALSEPAPEPVAEVKRHVNGIPYLAWSEDKWRHSDLSELVGVKLYAGAAPPMASPSDARDAARLKFLTESNRMTYVGGATEGNWKFHLDHDGGEDLRHDIDMCMKAAIEREGRT